MSDSEEFSELLAHLSSSGDVEALNLLFNSVDLIARNPNPCRTLINGAVCMAAVMSAVNCYGDIGREGMKIIEEKS